MGLASLGRDGHPQLGALGGKFDGVVQQIIAHLGNGVWIAPNHHGLLRKLGVHVQPALVDFPLQTHQHPEHDLADVELLLCRGPLRGLQAGQVQHPAHQPRQAAGFRGNEL
ncbi:hypothetical protein SDC9_204060 [bioreactor metagenome]|uniref:Uncharacterized protein n=1 Tax=bioreactor metagenome TaxID=1076179 RepID=A0A645IZS6_9ZZZZ